LLFLLTNTEKRKEGPQRAGNTGATPTPKTKTFWCKTPRYCLCELWQRVLAFALPALDLFLHLWCTCFLINN
ncbi:hypothetical protein ACTOVQ_05420, partial [Arcanobacterium canis]